MDSTNRFARGFKTMIGLRNPGRLALLGICVVGAISLLRAQQPQSPGAVSAAALPVERTARTDIGIGGGGVENPLKRAIDLAAASLEQARRLNDYTFTMVKREFVDGKLGQHEAVFMKIRRQPFSVYANTLGPVQPKGQEAIYVEGRNGGKVQAHTIGFKHRLVGTLTLDPTSPEMMAGCRYPMTTAGLENMLSSMVKMYQEESRFPENDVQIFSGAKVDGRSCTCVQNSHSTKRAEFPFQMTRIFYDDENGLPIRWEAYEFPGQQGAKPQLVEEYTYRNLRTNVGLTDRDFDTANDQYGYN